MSTEYVSPNEDIALASKPSSYRWVIPAVLFVVVTIAFLDRLNISVLIADDTFLTDMGIKGNTVKMGLLMTGMLIALGLSSLVLSPLGDIFGPRAVMTGAAALWGVSMLAGGLTSSFVVLLLSRVLLGVGEGLHWPMQSKFVANWFPQKEVGRANSIWLVGAKVGPVVAVPFFSWIITHYGWRFSFETLTGMSVAMMIVIWFPTRDTPEQCKWVNKAELDFIRSAGPVKALGWREKRAAFQRDFKILVVNRDFWVLTMVYVCQCCIFYGVLTWLPSYLKTARGFSWSALGGYTALTWVGAATATVLTGYVSDKLGRRGPFLALGMVGCGLGILASTLLQNNVHAAWAIIVGVTFSGCSMSGIWALVSKVVPADAVGSGSGIVQGVGIGISSFIPTILGYLIAVTGSYNAGLTTLVGITAVGAVCGLILTFKNH